MSSALKAIRKKCLDCVCGSRFEVRACPAKNCPLWEYRMGHRPKVNEHQQYDATEKQEDLCNGT